jgi:hypothetical protein
MTDWSRISWRLRRRILLGYEYALYALLVAMALAVALPAEADDEALHCGNTRSSASVITR